MKTPKKIYTLLIMALFFLPLIRFAVADNKKTASYGGLNSGDTIVYLTTFDKGPLESYYKEYYIHEGFDDETAKQLAKDSVEDFGNYEQIEAIKFCIIRVETDREDIGNNHGRRVWYNEYISEDRDDNKWELKFHEDYLFIMEFETKIYKEAVDPQQGLGVLFIAKGIDWKKFATAVDKGFESDYKGNIGARSLNDGIQTFYKVNFMDYGLSNIEASEKFRSTSQYTSKGVLYYYEWTYGNDVIIKYELEQSFYSELWVLLAIIIAIAAAIFIIMLYREIKR